MPRAAAVPSIVARIEDVRVILTVVQRALIIVSFVGKLKYHLSVKPPQTTRDIELLKDKTMSTKIGAYKNRNMTRPNHNRCQL
jgi:hypothetical protein